MKKIIKILAFIVLGLSLHAQSAELEKEALELLSGNMVKQLNLYGYFENKYEVQLYLVHDDSEWQGICYYPSSNTKLMLEGGKVNNKLILNETDSISDNLGMWSIDLKDEVYSAKWMNISKSVDFTIYLRVLNKINKDLDFRINSAESYMGKFINEDYTLTMFNIGFDDKKANICNIKNHYYLKSSVKCLNASCNSFEILIDKNNKNKINKLECDNSTGKNLEVKISNRFKTKFTSTIQRNGLVNLIEKPFINKHYRIYFIYPDFKKKEIPDFIIKIDNIFDKIKIELEQKSNREFDTDNRLILFVNGWFDIEFISKDYFSGIFNIQKSYSDKVISIPIIYSFKTKEEIDLFKQFKSDFNAQFYISQYIKESIKNLIKENKIYRRGDLKPSDFKYTTLTQYGIVFSTEFSSIFGVDKIILPYTELKDKIRRKSILNKIMLK